MNNLKTCGGRPGYARTRGVRALLAVATIVAAGTGALGQVRPLSEGNVEQLGRADSNSDPQVTASRVNDGNLGSIWESGLGNGPHSLNWYPANEFVPSLIEVVPAVPALHAPSVQIFFYRKDGTQIGSTLTRTSTTTSFTLDLPQLPTELVNRIEFRWSGGPVKVGEIKVKTFRPGAVNPLGFPPDQPVLQDAEPVVFGNVAQAFAMDTANLLSGGVVGMRERPVPGGDSMFNQKNGRIFGTPAEQVVALRRTNGTNAVRLEVFDFGTDPTQMVLRGTYSMPAMLSDSVSNFAIGDLDGVITNGLRHQEIAIAYEVLSGSQRRIRIDVLTFRDTQAWVEGQPATPTVLASTVLNRVLPNSGGINLGLMPDPATTQGRRIGLAIGRAGAQATPSVVMAYVNSSNRKFVVTAHTLATLASGSSVPLNDLQSSFEDYSESETRLSNFDLAVGNWWVNDQGFSNGPDRDEIVIATRGRGAVNSETWRSVRLLTLNWAEGTSILARDTEYTNRLIENRTPLVSVDPASTIRVLPLPEVDAAGNRTGAFDFVLKCLTQYGVVAQAYEVFPGFGEPGIRAMATDRFLWPFPTPAPVGQIGSQGEIGVGTALRSRTPAEIAARVQVPSVFMARTLPGVSAAEVVEVPVRTIGTRYGTAASLPLVTAGGANSSLPSVSSLIVPDLDGDSGYYMVPGGMYLGPGRRVAFDGYNAPTVLFQEPPKHVDYLRTGLFDGRSNRRIANLSKRRDFYAEYFDTNDSTIASTTQNQVSSSLGQSFGAGVTVTAAIESPNVDASVSTSVKANLDTQRTNTRTRIAQGSRSVGFSRSFQTLDDDQVEFPNRDFDLWQFPILGLANNANLTEPFYQISVSGEVRPSLATTGKAAENYHPRHISGNVLSYPRYDTPAAARLDAAGEAATIFNQNRSVQFQNQLFADTEYSGSSTSTSTITINNTITNSSQVQQDQSISTSLDVNVTAKVTGKAGPFPGVQLSAGLETSFDYGIKSSSSYSNMQLTSLTSNTTRGARFSRPGLINDPLLGTVNYNYYPVFFFDKSGAAKLKHYVNLPSNVTAWTQYYGGLDAALNLPSRIECDQAGTGTNCNLSTGPDRYQMKGFAVVDDSGTALPRLSDTTPTPGSIVSGDRVRLQARVYNLSAAQPTDATAIIKAGTTDVRFEVEEIEISSRTAIGPRTVIGTATLAQQLAPWETAWTNPDQAVWQTDGFGPPAGSTQPRYYRVNVIVDPANRLQNNQNQLVSETHELEDRDADPLVASGIRPVDAFSVDGRPLFLEKGQNNYGWFIVRIDPGVPGQPTPADADAFLDSSSLGLATGGGGFRTDDGAVAVRGQGIQFQVRARSQALARGPRLVGVYNGLPLTDDSNAIGFGVVGNINGQAASTMIVDTRTGLPWVPPTVGNFTLFARLLPAPGEPNINNNLDPITLRVVSAGANVLYVDDNAVTGLGDGSSWANAFSTLDLALAASGPDTTIRVAQGTYVPVKALTLDDLRTRTFELPSGVTIEGGYAGLGAPNPDARNPLVTRTILSGDLNGDDQPGFLNRGDNAYHVISADTLPAQVVLDGLYIRGGNASGASGRLNQGGGMLLLNGDTVVRGCVITDNFASSSGGGVFQDGGVLLVEDSVIGNSPTLASVTSFNRAGSVGGGVFVQNAIGMTLQRTVLGGNSAQGAGEGGAVYVLSSVGATLNATRITQTSSLGSAVRIINASTTMTNCLLDRNVNAVAYDTDAGGTLLNCTLADNRIGIQNRAGVLLVTNSILRNATRDANLSGAEFFTFSRSSNPAVAGTGNITADPAFVSQGSGDYRLAANSPCINTGSNAAVAGVTTDLAGSLRLRGGVVDMGAYEASGCVADVDDGSFTGTPDGGVGIEDLLYYISIYDAGVVAADVDNGSSTGTPDGGVGIEDLLYFLARYDTGC